MKGKQRIALWILAVLVLCTGCSLDVESFLQPPKIGGDQQAVQTALETYVRDTAGAGARFTPEYPMVGEYTAAFTLCNAQGFPVKDGEEATSAVAFYSLSTAPEETRINHLIREEDGWVSVADAVGNGTSIHQVAFGDLNGDGTAEWIAGWSGYNSRAFHLTVYDIAGGIHALSRDLLYSSFFVGDITAGGYDSLMLLTAGTEVSATLYNLQNGVLTHLGSAVLDGSIQQFGDMTLCRLAEGVHGLFVEGHPNSETAVTQLIYYKDGLHTPFTGDMTAYTTRTGQLPARDIDGDGIVEIPTHTVLEGHTIGQVGGSVTQWHSWDYATGTWQQRGYSLVNEADGYLVMLDETLRTKLETAYDSATHTLTLLDKDTNRPFLWLLYGIPLSDMPADGIKQMAILGTVEGREGYYAYYDPAVMSAEKVGYMVARF